MLSQVPGIGRMRARRLVLIMCLMERRFTGEQLPASRRSQQYPPNSCQTVGLRYCLEVDDPVASSRRASNHSASRACSGRDVSSRVAEKWGDCGLKRTQTKFLSRDAIRALITGLSSRSHLSRLVRTIGPGREIVHSRFPEILRL